MVFSWLIYFGQYCIHTVHTVCFYVNCSKPVIYSNTLK